LTPSFEENPLTQGHEIFVTKKLESLAQPKWKFCDLSLHRFDRAPECNRHTDGETDGHRDAQVMAKTREA